MSYRPYKNDDCQNILSSKNLNYFDEYEATTITQSNASNSISQNLGDQPADLYVSLENGEFKYMVNKNQQQQKHLINDHGILNEKYPTPNYFNFKEKIDQLNNKSASKNYSIIVNDEHDNYCSISNKENLGFNSSQKFQKNIVKTPQQSNPGSMKKDLVTQSKTSTQTNHSNQKTQHQLNPTHSPLKSTQQHFRTQTQNQNQFQNYQNKRKNSSEVSSTQQDQNSLHNISKNLFYDNYSTQRSNYSTNTNYTKTPDQSNKYGIKQYIPYKSPLQQNKKNYYQPKTKQSNESQRSIQHSHNESIGNCNSSQRNSLQGNSQRKQSQKTPQQQYFNQYKRKIEQQDAVFRNFQNQALENKKYSNFQNFKQNIPSEKHFQSVGFQDFSDRCQSPFVNTNRTGYGVSNYTSVTPRSITDNFGYKPYEMSSYINDKSLSPYSTKRTDISEDNQAKKNQNQLKKIVGVRKTSFWDTQVTNLIDNISVNNNNYKSIKNQDYFQNNDVNQNSTYQFQNLSQMAVDDKKQLSQGKIKQSKSSNDLHTNNRINKEEKPQEAHKYDLPFQNKSSYDYKFYTPELDFIENRILESSPRPYEINKPSSISKLQKYDQIDKENIPLQMLESKKSDYSASKKNYGIQQFFTATPDKQPKQSQTPKKEQDSPNFKTKITEKAQQFIQQNLIQNSNENEHELNQLNNPQVQQIIKDLQNNMIEDLEKIEPQISQNPKILDQELRKSFDQNAMRFRFSFSIQPPAKINQNISNTTSQKQSQVSDNQQNPKQREFKLFESILTEHCEVSRIQEKSECDSPVKNSKVIGQTPSFQDKNHRNSKKLKLEDIVNQDQYSSQQEDYCKNLFGANLLETKNSNHLQTESPEVKLGKSEAQDSLQESPEIQVVQKFDTQKLYQRPQRANINLDSMVNLYSQQTQENHDETPNINALSQEQIVIIPEDDDNQQDLNKFETPKILSPNVSDKASAQAHKKDDEHDESNPIDEVDNHEDDWKNTTLKQSQDKKKSFFLEEDLLENSQLQNSQNSLNFQNSQNSLMFQSQQNPLQSSINSQDQQQSNKMDIQELELIQEKDEDEDLMNPLSHRSNQTKKNNPQSQNKSSSENFHPNSERKSNQKLSNQQNTPSFTSQKKSHQTQSLLEETRCSNQQTTKHYDNTQSILQSNDFPSKIESNHKQQDFQSRQESLQKLLQNFGDSKQENDEKMTENSPDFSKKNDQKVVKNLEKAFIDGNSDENRISEYIIYPFSDQRISFQSKQGFKQQQTEEVSQPKKYIGDLSQKMKDCTEKMENLRRNRSMSNNSNSSPLNTNDKPENQKNFDVKPLVLQEEISPKPKNQDSMFQAYVNKESAFSNILKSNEHNNSQNSLSSFRLGCEKQSIKSSKNNLQINSDMISPRQYNSVNNGETPKFNSQHKTTTPMSNYSNTFSNNKPSSQTKSNPMLQRQASAYNFYNQYQNNFSKSNNKKKRERNISFLQYKDLLDTKK